MNLRDLRYFVALAETRHFGHAARRSFVSQPTLSGQIRKLEQQLDTILLATPIDDAELVARPLFVEPFWLALPRDHVLYGREHIRRRELNSLNMLLLAEGHCLADQMMDVCGRTQRSETGEGADLRAASLETLLQLVGAGMGATLVPALAMRGAWMTDAGVVTRPLEIANAVRRISLVWRKG